MKSWTVIVPVKELREAKTRLGTSPARADLALAFARDTVAAVLGCRRTAHVVIITDDPAVAASTAYLHATVTVEPDSGRGLNDSLRASLGRHPAPVAVVLADLPSLTADAFEDFLEFAEEQELSFVADAAGTGTTMIAGLDRLEPQFGPRSCARHAAAGYREFTAAAACARRDVDSDVDLWDARRLGLGRWSSEALEAAEVLMPDRPGA